LNLGLNLVHIKEFFSFFGTTHLGKFQSLGIVAMENSRILE